MLRVRVTTGEPVERINKSVNPALKLDYASSKLKADVSSMMIPLSAFMKSKDVVLDPISISDSIVKSVNLQSFLDIDFAVSNVDVLEDMVKNEMHRMCIYLNTKYDVVTDNFMTQCLGNLRGYCMNIVDLLSK